MKISSKLTIAGAFAASLLIGGCASTTSGSVYSSGQARQEQTVRMGVVESVRQVSIEGSKSGVGAVAGGVAGNMIEQGATKKQGLEITVKLDNGELRAITQDADEVFKPGERVRLLSGSGVTRVSH
jgi:outer membrane lipoprotein SlyB